MTQYLLSVHGPVEMDELGNYASEEDMQAAFEAVEAFNQKLQAEGYWVFAAASSPRPRPRWSTRRVRPR